ncbi:glycosyltransferase [Turicibacter sanguinis]|uniref:glycosyltransferase family 2 protein n=1 Tax=Turicibacter sanguinis TaxID=154288 RepID=UPI00130FEEF9|nr:glycosyltransferase family 2 protein [Turicibacter sanguinis]MDB8552845.1 glycosyltransferase family 2 protein [Turicibacter sanguinis]MTN43790.1 glycosyltransferase [Turicibacter sanguinis]MTN49639.1 glycosyltransferase [Turicibacter sanguinis]MTN52670.1 glycosyltransferase [Turicibacter sanguinis]MTN55920.1 glycosyltransferase [Turicibacter sanguinis]
MSQISVIIPAYNVAKYIDKCFKSLVTQTFKDFEVIVINDGSTDETLTLIREWEQKDSRFKVMDKQNEGVGKTRNLGLSLSSAPYVIFIDPDDYLHEEMLEKLYEGIRLSDASVAICEYYDCYEDSSEQFAISLPKFESETIDLMNHKEILFKINPAPWNKLIKKEILTANQLLFPTNYRSEDLAFTLMLLAHCEKIAMINQPLYYYLANRLNNVSSAYDERILHTLLALEASINYYKKLNKFKTFEDELEMVCINQVLYELQKVIHIKDSSLALKIMNEFYDYLQQEFKGWTNNKYYQQQKANQSIKEKLRASIYESKMTLKLFYKFKS